MRKNSELFAKDSSVQAQEENQVKGLQAKVDQLAVENDFLSKVLCR